jgi:hypothetical protein
MQTFSTRKRFSSLISVMLVVTMFFLSGCATKLGRQTVKVKYYPQCYKPIQDMRAAEEQLRKNVATGALVGAGAGAAVGLASGEGVKGVLLGALIGAAVGAAGTYIISAQLQEKSAQERIKAYNSTLDMESQSLATAAKTAKMTCDCYAKSYDELKRNYQRGNMSKAEMLERLTEIRNGNNDALTIMQNYNADVSKNQQSFSEVVKLERAKPAGDRISKRQIQQIESKSRTYNNNSKSLNASIANLSKRQSIYDSNISEQDLVLRGVDMLASRAVNDKM